MKASMTWGCRGCGQQGRHPNFIPVLHTRNRDIGNKVSPVRSDRGGQQGYIRLPLGGSVKQSWKNHWHDQVASGHWCFTLGGRARIMFPNVQFILSQELLPIKWYRIYGHLPWSTTQQSGTCLKLNWTPKQLECFNWVLKMLSPWWSTVSMQKQDQLTKNTTVLLTLHQQITRKHLETIAPRYRHSVRKLGQQMSMGTHPRINLNMWIQRIFVCPQKWTGGLLASSETYQTAHFKVENSNGCAGYLNST